MNYVIVGSGVLDRPGLVQTLNSRFAYDYKRPPEKIPLLTYLGIAD